MTRKVIALSLVALGLLAFAGCRARTDRSEGSVILSVTDFDGLPILVSASSGPFQIGELVLRNVPKEPGGVVSDLQTIEIRSYEVRYRRRDGGRRVPPPLVQGLFGNVAVNSETTYNNLAFMLSDQFATPPLSDLARTGVDPETNSTVIVLDVTMRFFGRTLAGDDIVSAPASFTIEVRP